MKLDNKMSLTKCRTLLDHYTGLYILSKIKYPNKKTPRYHGLTASLRYSTIQAAAELAALLRPQGSSSASLRVKH